MAPRKPRSETEVGLDRVVEQLTAEELREVVTWAAEWHEDVERRVRLTAARSSGDLRALRAEVDRGLRTRRFLGYRESVEWARAARPVVTELDAAVRAGPTRELVELLERGIAHVVKVIQTKADDSSGIVGDLARDLLNVHATACDARVADPVKLARWMIRFRFVDQDFFEADPVRYRAALGEVGLAEFRSVLSAQSDQDGFAARYARERLAVLDGDSGAIIALLGGDLSRPHQFIRVAEAMVELGWDEEAVGWARRGIEQTTGWQTDQLYDIACAAHGRRGEQVGCSRCVARSTSGRRRAPAIASFAPRLRRSTPGRWRAMRRVACCGIATQPGWLTRCSTTARTSSRGRPQPHQQGSSSESGHGCVSPNHGRRPIRRRPCPCTGG